MRRILLVEPAYRNKYPPLGLMKISSYHKLAGDDVFFIKGCLPEFRNQKWDRVYVSTLFTFHWSMTIKTIKYYSKSVGKLSDIFVGGVMATLMASDINDETGATVIPGLLDRPGILDDKSKTIVDALIPDYQILDSIEYTYGAGDSYIAYATRGCPNSCDFCAVRKIEPCFKNYLPLKQQIKAIENVYGQKQNLILLDNNVLASDQFKRIIDDIKTLGFERDSLLNKKRRFIDFNQGLDVRRLSDEKMALLSETAIRPLRIAFDDVSMKDLYMSRIKMAAKYNMINLSNYILYNYKDTPEDFHERLLINCQLNEELGTKIYSFPMKYIPLDSKDRTYIGKNWNRKLIRGVQCILLATRGMVSPKIDFFNAAFGSDSEEFLEIANMPEEYIINRRKYEKDEAFDWKKLYRALTDSERAVLFEMNMHRHITEDHLVDVKSTRLRKLLSHYIESDKVLAKRNAERRKSVI